MHLAPTPTRIRDLALCVVMPCSWLPMASWRMCSRCALATRKEARCCWVRDLLRCKRQLLVILEALLVTASLARIPTAVPSCSTGSTAASCAQRLTRPLVTHCCGHAAVHAGDVPAPPGTTTIYTPLLTNLHLHYYNVRLDAMTVDGQALSIDRVSMWA